MQPQLKYELKSVDELWEESEYEVLFGLKKLRTVKLKLKGAMCTRVGMFGDPERFFDNFVAMLEKGFKERGRDVKIVTECEEWIVRD